MSFADRSHKRLNILTGEWVLVSPHRNKRPWQGKTEALIKEERPKYDSGCYLCPGNTRAGGKQNPVYTSTYVFDNDFPALQNEGEPEVILDEDGLLTALSENGICRVICYSPNHSLTMADMTVEMIGNVVRTWQEQYKDLGSKEGINYVQIFENKGEIMGCSNPHPHGQIWAQQHLPNEITKKDWQLRNYFERNGYSILTEYISKEKEKPDRIIFENEHFIALVPFWAVWPFETMIIPHEHQQQIVQMNEVQLKDFVQVLKTLTSAYDKIFDTSFPYSCGIHQSPTNGENNDHWHWHMCFYPPLLRSATVKKFMVGYEMFGMPQRDITAETAAEKLRSIILENPEW